MPGYVPPSLLSGPHLQSILASSIFRRSIVMRQSQTFRAASVDEIVDCGGGVKLLAHHNKPLNRDMKKVVVLIHGWEGSANSSYVLSVSARLWQAGFRVIRLNLRDHGDSLHLNRELFHSCRLDEAIGAVRWVQDKFPDEALLLGGFSLGGNFAMRIAAQADEAGLIIDRVVAVCPVLDPVQTMAALDGGWPIYRWYFMRRWRRSLERKKLAFPGVYNFSQLNRFNNLTSMTDYFVRHYTEFSDLGTYLRGYAITGDRLESVCAPTRMLMAEDDPVIPISGLDRVARNKHLQVERSPWGGHCGFLSGYNLQTWLDEYVLDAFTCSHDGPGLPSLNSHTQAS